MRSWRSVALGALGLFGVMDGVAHALPVAPPIDGGGGGVISPPSCNGGTQPTGTAYYSCDLTLTDLYARGVAGQTVTLTSSWCSSGQTYTTQATASATTASNGRVVVSMWSPRANKLHCRVNTTNPIVYEKTVSNGGPAFASYTTVTVAAQKYPNPTSTFTPCGASCPTSAARGKADLYMSGSFDKVVVIQEPFDTGENSLLYNRNSVRYWAELQSVLVPLYQQGYDVIMSQPASTGQNLHEQAAELAQVISWAANGSPTCGGGNIAVFGFSMGGLVARLATARYEADSSWRSSLGLNANLRVRLLISGDSPQYGANVNVDLQRMMWDKKTDQEIWETTNLDSCAAVQMLRGYFDPASGSVTSEKWKSAFLTGTQSTVFSRGVNYLCQAGPAIAFLDGDGTVGWADGPRRVGWSQGNSGHTNRCYGDSRDINADGLDGCPYWRDVTSTPPYIPQAGQTFIKVNINNWFDQYLNAFHTAAYSDLVAGSRNDNVQDQRLYSPPGSFLWFGDEVHLEQRFAPTFIPWRSAIGTEGPVAGWETTPANIYGSRATPFARWWQNDHAGFHAKQYAQLYTPVFEELGAQLACPTIYNPPIAPICCLVAR